MHKKKKGKYLRTTHLGGVKEYSIYEMPDGEIVAYKDGSPVWKWKSMKDFKLTDRLLMLV